MLIATVLTLPVVAQVEIAIPVLTWQLDVRGLHTSHHEHIQVSDQCAFSIDKPMSDGVNISDTQVYSFAAPKKDSFSIADAFVRTCDYRRLFSEELRISDTLAFSLNRPTQDAVGVTDVFLKEFGKGASDTVKFDDAGLTKSLGSIRREIVVISDSFFLNGNDYCDGTYFAEEYVGVARFT